ncbi:ABC transporter substrate-binding protein, partial [Mesorhizobium sp. M7A.T.Ca.TU.009.02.1.1]
MPLQQRVTHRPKQCPAASILATALLGLGLITLPGIGHAEGITLKIFGGSALDELAPRQPPDEQKKIQQQVIDGFLKANPDVAAVEWDAEG